MRPRVSRRKSVRYPANPRGTPNRGDLSAKRTSTLPERPSPARKNGRISSSARLVPRQRGQSLPMRLDHRHLVGRTLFDGLLQEEVKPDAAPLDHLASSLRKRRPGIGVPGNEFALRRDGQEKQRFRRRAWKASFADPVSPTRFCEDSGKVQTEPGQIRVTYPRLIQANALPIRQD